ncbi:hypothetical protein [Glycomyces salinus]|uniref:hypothetical protein n=1 Tax=Glycomyces salinus TaxID=980294 RepID=UPI0018EA3863|nr:hypothetical protein [Glycomyces salinus]
MSSYNNPQQYRFEPNGQPPQPPQQPPPQYQHQPYQQPGQPQYQQPPPGPPPVQPYVEGAPPVAPGGGQPPHFPPGAYTPAPPPPPRPRRRGRVAIASILSVALLLGVGAFVFFQFVWTTGPDPAERFPSSTSMYAEINLDPSFDQTPKLLEHLSRFEGADFDDTDDFWQQLIDESGLEGVEAERDLTSWLGRRHGVAMWEHDGSPYAVVNLASTDADAAREGMERLVEAAGAPEEELAYTVNEDSVLIVGGAGNAQAALEAVQTEAETSPLSDSSGYDEARSWLDGDQLLVYWIDADAVTEMAAAMGEEEDLAGFEEAFSGHAIMGVSAFDEGFELTYRHFGTEDSIWTGSEDLMDNFGELPASGFAVSADIPDDLSEATEEWMDEFEDLTSNDYCVEDEDYGYGEDCGSTGGMFTGADEIIDLLSGAQLSFAADVPSNGSDFDPETILFRAILSEDRAQDLEDLVAEATEGEMPEGVEVDGSELTYQGANVADGTLADDSRFGSFADAAPDNTALAVWVDLEWAGEYESEVEPLSAFAFAHGTVDGDDTGVARLYLK